MTLSTPLQWTRRRFELAEKVSLSSFHVIASRRCGNPYRCNNKVSSLLSRCSDWQLSYALCKNGLFQQSRTFLRSPAFKWRDDKLSRFGELQQIIGIWRCNCMFRSLCPMKEVATAVISLWTLSSLVSVESTIRQTLCTPIYNGCRHVRLIRQNYVDNILLKFRPRCTNN